jgi:hypothetical protein
MTDTEANSDYDVPSQTNGGQVIARRDRSEES